MQLTFKNCVINGSDICIKKLLMWAITPLSPYFLMNVCKMKLIETVTKKITQAQKYVHCKKSPKFCPIIIKLFQNE